MTHDGPARDAKVQDRAQKDEACTWCGFPFDTGVRVYTHAAHEGHVYCTRRCFEEHKAERAPITSETFERIRRGDR